MTKTSRARISSRAQVVLLFSSEPPSLKSPTWWKKTLKAELPTVHRRAIKIALHTIAGKVSGKLCACAVGPLAVQNLPPIRKFFCPQETKFTFSVISRHVVGKGKQCAVYVPGVRSNNCPLVMIFQINLQRCGRVRLCGEYWFSRCARYL